MEQYGWNFCALWEKVEAFGGSPGIHQGMIEAMLKDPTRVANVGKPTVAEICKAEDDATEAVKAALLISGADKMRFGQLKDELANIYLLGMDQYPDTYEMAMRILGNYQTNRPSRPYQGDGTESGLAFIQRGGRGHGHGGRGGGAGCGMPTKEGADASAEEARSTATTSTATTGSSDQASTGGGKRVNQAGDSHCYNCGKMDHWVYKCPDLTAEQQAQLHMHIEAEGNEGEKQQEGSKEMHSPITGRTWTDVRPSRPSRQTSIYTESRWYGMESGSTATQER